MTRHTLTNQQAVSFYERSPAELLLFDYIDTCAGVKPFKIAQTESHCPSSLSSHNLAQL